MEHYNEFDDYYVVFDYVCDVEILCESKSILKFYQVKTKNGVKPFDKGFLTRKGKKKNSVVGNLFKLYRKDETCRVELYIVGNVPFKDGEEIIDDINGFSFSKMSSNTKLSIFNQLKEEKIIEEDVTLDNLYYIYSPLNIINYDNTLLGEFIKFYTANIDDSMIKPTVLYLLLKDLILQKACCEITVDNYNEVLKNKAVSKEEFKNLLLLHKDQSNNIVERCVQEYKSIQSDDISGNLRIKQALTRIVENNNIEAINIMNNISSNIEKELLEFKGSIHEFIVFFIRKYDSIFSSEYDYYEKYAYVLYQYEKMMEA